MFHLRFEIAIPIIVEVILLFHVGASVVSVKFGSSDECITPGGRRGICKNIYRCDPLLSLLIKGKSRPPLWVVDFLRRSHCGFEGKDPVVCCPVAVKPKDPRANENETVKKHPIEKFLSKSCGVIQTLDKVIGGSTTALHEFPWMALIGYNTSFGIQYRCGGSLISPRYILTAAHCVTTLKDIYPVYVRLGEHDLESFEDCSEGEEICNPPVKDIAIEELIPHPQYSKPGLHNDIALIRLANRVEYMNHIRPICLPLNKDFGSLLNNKAIVAGWGTTELGISARVLRRVTLPIVPFEECSKVYRKRISIFPESQICAGGESERDSCSGDSGGPLQVIGSNPAGEPAYIQQGIVSFGPKVCGTRGLPGVYTRVSHYVDWILRNVKE